jgi:hypothetical protein
MNDFLFKKDEIISNISGLFYEYKSEEKISYQNTFNKCVLSSIRKKIKNNELYFFITEIETFEDIEIQIFVNMYCKVETYFLSPYNLSNYATLLMANQKFRQFTKLCFYIEEYIKPIYEKNILSIKQ